MNIEKNVYNVFILKFILSFPFAVDLSTYHQFVIEEDNILCIRHKMIEDWSEFKKDVYNETYDISIQLVWKYYKFICIIG